MTFRDRALTCLQWISVIALGTWVGGTLYQMLVIVPMWSASPPDSVHWFFQATDYNRLIFRFFGPPFMLARTLPVVAALFVGWHRPRHRRPLLIASACLLFAVAYTLVYIYPINAVVFEHAGLDCSAEQLQTLIDRWIRADRLRFAIGLVSFLALLHAFRLPLLARLPE